MGVITTIVTLFVVGVLVYNLYLYLTKSIDYTRMKQPDFSIEEVLDKPAPKKRKPYKKRKPKNDKGEK